MFDFSSCKSEADLERTIMLMEIQELEDAILETHLLLTKKQSENSEGEDDSDVGVAPGKYHFLVSLYELLDQYRVPF